MDTFRSVHMQMHRRYCIVLSLSLPEESCFIHVCFDICLRTSVPVIHFTTNGVHPQPLRSTGLIHFNKKKKLVTLKHHRMFLQLKMFEKSRELQLQIKIDTTIATKLRSTTAAKS